jgi:hypothetical protein
MQDLHTIGINPHAAEALHKLSNRIRAIPDAIDAALKGEG